MFRLHIDDDHQIHRPCGNYSGAQMCPNNYICLTGNHSLVNNGITSFDTISASFLVIVRLFQRDYWEEVLQYLTATAGPWSILLFIAVIYYGSFQLCALLWTPIALAYNYMRDELWENDLLNDLNEVSAIHRFASTIPIPFASTFSLKTTKCKEKMRKKRENTHN